MKKALASIETEEGRMIIYYHGPGCLMTAETEDGETVETVLGVFPKDEKNAIERIKWIYGQDVWELVIFKPFLVVTVKDENVYSDEYESLNEAEKSADYRFSLLTKYDRKKTEAFYILETINPDPEAENHFDGNIVKNYIGEFFTADRETGTFIEKYRYLDEAIDAIKNYEKEDQEDGNFTNDFYDVVDGNHCSVRKM